MTFLFLPFTASLCYCFAAMSLKTAINGGIGPWRSVFITNWFMLLTSAPFLLLPGETDILGALPMAALAGTTFFFGQLFTFLAITRGDVSVATPVLGTKIIFVALLGAGVFGSPVPPTLWLAVILATSGIALLQFEPGARHRKVALTATLAAASAFAFATTDVLMQQFAPIHGARGFVPLSFAWNALLSFGLIPLFSRPLRDIPRPLRYHLFGGGLLIAFQSALMAAALSLFGRAPEVNIVYSLRGLWSVLLVWFIGHKFGNLEHRAGRRVFLFRLAGACCALGAIALILFAWPGAP